MEILIFLFGLVVGIVLTFVVFRIIEKKSKTQSQETFQQMQLYFENLANKALKDNSSELSQQNKEKLTELLTPFREQLSKFEKKVEENIYKETEQFARLDTNIKNVLEAGSKISRDTNNLATALKGDSKTQGRWGELVLERILEVSGLRKDEEYFTQKSFNAKKPDAVILLPDNRCIYVDAKTTLASYDDFINAEDEISKQQYLKMFKDSVKTHITGLSKKEYYEIEEYSSPEYVLMFIPIESCYSLLFSDDAQLWDFAWKNKIMPVCPSNLLATLKIINSVHTVSRQNKNAQEIAKLAGKMANKIYELSKDIKKVQDGLKCALVKLDGKDNISRQIERIADLGAQDIKAIPVFEED